MKVAIYGRPFHEDFTGAAVAFFDMIGRMNIQYMIYGDFADFLHQRCHIPLHAYKTYGHHSEIDHPVDFFFSIGGDGTFLEAVTYVRDRGIPLVGINSGQLGFLANISRHGIGEALEAIRSGNIQMEERSLLELITERPVLDDFQYALNELTIQKSDANMITIQTYLGDLYLNSYWADGLIISTPTGSTAYSMSVGGPILTPLCHNLIISPIAPHTLSVRPVLIPDHYELTLKINSRNRRCLVSMDHRHTEIDHTLVLKVKKAGFKIRMVNLMNQNFFITLRNKLMWGVDKRN